jgi:hypothetical protein
MPQDDSLKDHFDSEGNPKDPNMPDIPPKEEKPPFSPEFSPAEKEKTVTSLKKLTEIPEEFDLAKIDDIDFLLSIFAEPYDQYKSLQYLTKMREKLLKTYPDTPILNEYLFWTTISRRLQIEYQILHVKNAKSHRADAESVPHLKIMKEIATQITFLQKALNETLEKFEKMASVADLHESTMDEIEKFIGDHIGEFTFSCKNCGTVVNTQGLPHWAIEKKEEVGGERTYYIFSPEMWYLHKGGILPLHLMAFILRTSVEGVLITAERRGEKVEKNEELIILEEKKSQQLLLGFIKQKNENIRPN